MSDITILDRVQLDRVRPDHGQEQDGTELVRPDSGQVSCGWESRTNDSYLAESKQYEQLLFSARTTSICYMYRYPDWASFE